MNDQESRHHFKHSIRSGPTTHDFLTDERQSAWRMIGSGRKRASLPLHFTVMFISLTTPPYYSSPLPPINLHIPYLISHQPLVPPLLPHMSGGFLVPRVVLIVVVPIVLIVHLLRPTLGLVLRLLAVVVVLALGLGQLVDFSAGKACEEFLCKGVGDGFVYGE